jgi:TonB family protein
MNISTFLHRLFHSPIPYIAAMLLIAPAWSIPGFCCGIYDAAAAGNLEEISALLEKNPELVSSKDERGWTPLHAAAWNVRADASELLLSRGANVNARNNEGETPLHLAAQKSNRRMVALLLANKAEINAKDKKGKTPLDMACEFVADLLQPDELVTPPVPIAQHLQLLTEEVLKTYLCIPHMVFRAAIRADGTVDNVEVIIGPGDGLEELAIKSIAEWRFKPAARNGMPIDMKITIEMLHRCF